jgi:hypothetical protein
MGANDPVVFGHQGVATAVANVLSPDKAARDKTKRGRTTIHSDAWYEWVLVAQYLFRADPEAEIADVFEWFRTRDLGGTPITAGLLARVNREVATELGPWE